jgi:hypothetical protein
VQGKQREKRVKGIREYRDLREVHESVRVDRRFRGRKMTEDGRGEEVKKRDKVREDKRDYKERRRRSEMRRE